VNTDPSWAGLPCARQAVAEGQNGALLRLARTAAGLTLDQAGRQIGYSASTLSRMERGKQPLTDVMVLRRLAAMFDIPPRLFGLADPPGVFAAHRPLAVDRVPANSATEGGDDPVRRRDVLGGLAGLATAPLLTSAPVPGDASADPTPELVTGLEEALLRPTGPVRAIGPAGLRSGLAAVKSDFQTSRYRALANRLPGLLALVETLCRGAGRSTPPNASPWTPPASSPRPDRIPRPSTCRCTGCCCAMPATPPRKPATGPAVANSSKRLMQ
jgi:transcriptional regulator with XRE-family HTH domain